MIHVLRRSKPTPAWPLDATPRVHWASPQSRGLVAWWPLSWCTGNVAPEVFKAGHGTAAQLDWHADGMFGATPWFEGAEEITFSDRHLPAGASPRSLCAWLNFSELPIAGRTWGALFYGSTANEHGLMIGTGYTVRWQPPGCLGVSQWGQELVTPRAYNDGAWHHLAATFDGALWSLYVDGELESAKPMPTDTQTSTGRIGSLNFGPTYYWKGSLRDVRVYARALSAAEVRLLNDPPSRFDLWMPRRQWLARRASGPTCFLDVGHVYTTGANSGQSPSTGSASGASTMPGADSGETSSAGAAAGDLTVPGALAGMVK